MELSNSEKIKLKDVIYDDNNVLNYFMGNHVELVDEHYQLMWSSTCISLDLKASTLIPAR